MASGAPRGVLSNCASIIPKPPSYKPARTFATASAWTSPRPPRTGPFTMEKQRCPNQHTQLGSGHQDRPAAAEDAAWLEPRPGCPSAWGQTARRAWASTTPACPDLLRKLRLPTWLESSPQIKKAGGLQRGKTGSIDARRIAEHACRFRDRVRLWGRPAPSRSSWPCSARPASGCSPFTTDWPGPWPSGRASSALPSKSSFARAARRRWPPPGKTAKRVSRHRAGGPARKRLESLLRLAAMSSIRAKPGARRRGAPGLLPAEGQGGQGQSARSQCRSQQTHPPDLRGRRAG